MNANPMTFNPIYLHNKEVSPEEIKSFRKKFLQLNEEIQMALKQGNRSPIGDGVFYPEGYLRANTKILWLMKEPYDTKKGESIEDVKTGGWYFSPSFYENKKFGRDLATWYPIINLSHAILSRQTIWDQNTKMSDNCSFLANVLSHIGYVNIQKLASPTREKTVNASIHAAFDANKEWLERQFKLLNPEIIIGANTLNHNVFVHFGLKGNRIAKTTSNEAYDVNGKLFIRAYHPAQRKIKKEVYINDILSCVQIWRQKIVNEIF